MSWERTTLIRSKSILNQLRFLTASTANALIVPPSNVLGTQAETSENWFLSKIDCDSVLTEFCTTEEEKLVLVFDN